MKDDFSRKIIIGGELKSIRNTPGILSELPAHRSVQLFDRTMCCNNRSGEFSTRAFYSSNAIPNLIDDVENLFHTWFF